MTLLISARPGTNRFEIAQGVVRNNIVLGGIIEFVSGTVLSRYDLDPQPECAEPKQSIWGLDERARLTISA
jgi:hypothetical protein